MGRCSFISLTTLALLTLGACASTPPYGQETDPGVALRRCHELYDDGSYKDANMCYEHVRARFGGSHISREAELKMADIYFEKKEYLLAAESYRAFAKLHPTDRLLAYAYYRAGLSYLKESPKAIDRDQEYLDDAIGYLEIGLRYFPDSDYEQETQEAYKEARRRIGARNLYVGKFYYKRKEYRSAMPRFAIVADDFPNMGLDSEALYLLAKSYLELDERKKAFDVTAILKSRHPNSKYLPMLTKDLGLD